MARGLLQPIGRAEAETPQRGRPAGQVDSRLEPRKNGALQDPLSTFFPPDLLPSTELNEVYELRLAGLEATMLSKKELLERGAYFLAVNGQATNHFKICTGGGVELPQTSGARLQSFLATHRFKSSDATHGLFPYRGKFHPQMIKAIINLMGVRPGDTLLDPMAGSGTTSVEASLMGINSISVDVSPFCVFMTEAKLVGLREDVAPLEKIVASARETRRVFKELSSKGGRRKILDRSYEPKNLSRGCLDLMALAFMDSRGFAERSSRKSHEGFFSEILTKYVRTIGRFQNVWKQISLELGTPKAVKGDARRLDVEDNSVDGVVFSPPYSFAIDYVENDSPHLEYEWHAV